MDSDLLNLPIRITRVIGVLGIIYASVGKTSGGLSAWRSGVGE